MAAALARVRAHGNPAVRPLRRALRDSLLGAIPPEQGLWCAPANQPLLAVDLVRGPASAA